MISVRDAAEALEAALTTVDGARFYRDLGAVLDPPAIVLGPPALGWQSYCMEPSSARFTVYIVEKADGRAVERLWDLVPLVINAVEHQVESAAVQEGPMAALPGVYSSGGHELPSYELMIEMGL